jgi:hypothetical protein
LGALLGRRVIAYLYEIATSPSNGRSHATLVLFRGEFENLRSKRARSSPFFKS